MDAHHHPSWENNIYRGNDAQCVIPSIVYRCRRRPQCHRSVLESMCGMPFEMDEQTNSESKNISYSEDSGKSSFWSPDECIMEFLSRLRATSSFLGLFNISYTNRDNTSPGRAISSNVLPLMMIDAEVLREIFALSMYHFIGLRSAGITASKAHHKILSLEDAHLPYGQYRQYYRKPAR